MSTAPRSRPAFQIYAAAVLVLNIAVILWGALVRATGSGAGMRRTLAAVQWCRRAASARCGDHHRVHAPRDERVLAGCCARAVHMVATAPAQASGSPRVGFRSVIRSDGSDHRRGAGAAGTGRSEPVGGSRVFPEHPPGEHALSARGTDHYGLGKHRNSLYMEQQIEAPLGIRALARPVFWSWA